MFQEHLEDDHEDIFVMKKSKRAKKVILGRLNKIEIIILKSQKFLVTDQSFLFKLIELNDKFKL